MNIVGASAGTGRQLARARPGQLRQRVVSALALLPLPIAAVWFGWPWLQLVTAAAAAVMAWEWGCLCQRARPGADAAVLVRIVLIGVVVAPVAGAALANPGLAVALSFLGAGVVYLIACGAADLEPRWAALGTLWVALPCIAFLWLASEKAGGRATLFWVLAAVWATDIGAYAFGYIFGGPRLAPRWSPRKTWAGLAGGMLCAALTGAATARILGISSALWLTLLSAGLAVVGQFGDLAESMAKRRFGVKDSGGLIPGHGGLLDRLDGLLAVAPAVALLTWIGGHNLLTWR
jgi:phosphatidate cytidylyltransferase